MSHDVICGDALTVLQTLPSESVHCLVSSPPYFALRDYGTATWKGGNADCDHRKVSDSIRATASSSLGGGKKTTGHQQEGYGAECGKCGARRIDQQIGLEASPEEYVGRLVAVFHEARRVLHPSGVAFVNIGDSYAGSWGNQGRKPERGTQRVINGPMLQNLEPYPDKQSGTGTVPDVWGLKPKDLMLMPHRVAIALQQDGWWVRSDICWVKRNPMPESITDRPTKAHEYVFLLAKAERYYYDAAAVAEPSVTEAGTAGTWNGNRDMGLPDGQTWFARPNLGGSIDGFRNRRSWWDIPTEPYPLSHFAVMPSALVDLVFVQAPATVACAHPVSHRGSASPAKTEPSRVAAAEPDICHPARTAQPCRVAGKRSTFVVARSYPS